MSAIKKFVSDTFIYGLSTIVSRLLNFLLTPLFVKNFPTAVFGVMSSLYASASMINALLAFGMETTYFRYLQKVDKEDREKVFNNSFFIILVTSGLFLITVFVFNKPIASWLGNGERLAEYMQFLKFFSIILVADALAVIPFAKLRAQGRPIRYSVLKLINILILIFSNLFLILWLPQLMTLSSFWQSFASGWFQQGWLGNVFISNLLASVVTLIMLLPQLMSFRLQPDKKLLMDMFKYSFPILIANISFIINENLDKMLFRKLMPGEIGERELGIYSAVSKLAIFLNLFVTAFRLGAEPFFFSYSKNKNAQKTYALIMDYFVIIMVMVMVGICANISWLKYFIEGSAEERVAYWSGLYAVPILLFNFVLLGIYMNLSVWYKLSDQTRYALYISGIGALLTILLNILFIPKYSYLGAILCTSIAYVVMVALSYFWGQKNYPIPYHTSKILGYLACGVLISGLCTTVLNNSFWYGNLLFLAFLVTVFFLEKGNVIRIIISKEISE